MRACSSAVSLSTFLRSSHLSDNRYRSTSHMLKSGRVQTLQREKFRYHSSLPPVRGGARRLDKSAIQKFHTLKQEWKTVLPACSGKCSNAPNLGWITKGVTKKAPKPRPKRKHVGNIDLCTFRPRPIEGCFADWLADSKLAWEQLRFVRKNQIKRRRKR